MKNLPLFIDANERTAFAVCLLHAEEGMKCMSMVKHRKSKVFVLMSGGVDSSVAAALLQAEGFDVVGFHLKCWSVEGCPVDDEEDARRVAQVLGIPFYVMHFEKEYKERVVDYFIEAYRVGLTPNPDVLCNREIKFGLFLAEALQLGADYVASGHYVRLQCPKTSHVSNSRRAQLDINRCALIENCTLSIAKDADKDQSYFLWTLTKQQLQRCLFPIGDYRKSEVRELARKFGLPNAFKKDSQGVCFIGRLKMRDFLANYIPVREGAVVDPSGKVLGRHPGAVYFTIGQRHGLDVKNGKGPYYVAKKDSATNTLLVAKEGSKLLQARWVRLRNVHWISGDAFTSPCNVQVRCRYRQSLAEARWDPLRQRLIFDKPMNAVAEGQSAVMYQGQQMLGGGVIEEVLNLNPQL